MSQPRLLVGGASSGSGKTSLVLGLLEALRRRGIDVRPFKAGPDYLDPALHTAVLGRPSRNLDAMLMGRAGVLACLRRASRGADVALVEGVMGYYDGEPESSADLARLISAPAILVLDASASAESVAAMALGFARYRRRSGVSGFVANRVAGEGHYALVRDAVERRVGLPMLGYLPDDPRLELPSRHLGLVAPGENDGFDGAVRALGDAVSAHVDLGRLLAIAERAGELAPESGASVARVASLARGAKGGRERKASSRPVKIAVATDEAFAFYYEDNLDALKDLGAELAFFSPLRDARLPEGSAALYLGGGYPELHADLISGNNAMRDSIRAAYGRGMPIFAECGGYLYLLEALEANDGGAQKCVGIAPGVARSDGRLAALGYYEGRTLGPSPLGPPGSRLRGHAFHYYSVEGGGGSPALELSEPGKAESRKEGYSEASVFASFLHLHFAGNPAAARSFVAAARRYSMSRSAGGR